MPTGARRPATPSPGTFVAPAGPGLPAAKTVVPADFWTRPFQAAEAGGIATIVVPAAPIGYALLIERIAISTDSANQTSADVYIGATTNLPGVDHSPSANQDFSDYPRPLMVPGGEELLIVFQSMSANSTARARVQGWTVAAADLPAFYLGGVA